MTHRIQLPARCDRSSGVDAYCGRVAPPALLWGTRQLSERGPRHVLTIDQIVAAAIAIADADKDLSTLSMRRVGESLGVGTMSLYTYVTSRAELVEAMLDSVYGEAVGLLEKTPVGDWRAGLRHVAAVNWEMYPRHPWVLQIFIGRPPLGPHAIAKYDLELRAVDGVGLTDVQMDATVTLVHTHVEGVARRKVEAERAERRSGVTDLQWWEAAAPALAQVFDPARYPSRAGWAVPRDRNNKPRTTSNMSTRSAWTASSTD